MAYVALENTLNTNVKCKWPLRLTTQITLKKDKISTKAEYSHPQSWRVEESDEIDLRELFIILWRQKTLILLFTGLFAIAGITYAIQAKQVWSAHSVIQAPEKLDMLPMLRIASQAKSVGITEFPDNQAIYNEFINEFNAYDNQREYLESGDFFKNCVTAAQLDDKGQRRWLRDWAKLISATPIDRKDDKQGTMLTASADTSVRALNILKGYINFITFKQLQKLKSSLLIEKSFSLDTKTTELKWAKENADRILKHEIEQVKIAMTVAKAAGVELPLENYSTIDRFPITLGSKGLEKN